MHKKTLILGASTNPSRYSNIASKRLTQHQHETILLGKSEGYIAGLTIQTGFPQLSNIHTVTMYLNANKQQQYYDYLLKLAPKRIIFNPGSENPELAKIAKSKGIEIIEACTLVMLSVGNY